ISTDDIVALGMVYQF
ncbi:hypothetical protein CFSAN001081_16829, partial [Salmonella enterica subsp. enterica serovar London str. CFSAN001081]